MKLLNDVSAGREVFQDMLSIENDIFRLKFNNVLVFLTSECTEILEGFLRIQINSFLTAFCILKNFSIGFIVMSCYCTFFFFSFFFGRCVREIERERDFHIT